MALLAAFIGAISAPLGIGAAYLRDIPAGPAIVLAAAAIFLSTTLGARIWNGARGQMSDPAFPHIHDHRACMTATLAAAETLARTRGQRLTPLRRRVLEIVLESHRPTGAYDVLASLARDRTRPAPPTVYRALEFLLGQGFVHRIDSLSAFVGCFAPEKAHRSRFFLCLRCGRAAEIEDDESRQSARCRGSRGGIRCGTRNRRTCRRVRRLRKHAFRRSGIRVIGWPH